MKVESKFFLCKSFEYVEISTNNNRLSFFSHKILQLLKLSPQISDIAIEQRISNFFRRFVSNTNNKLRLFISSFSIPSSVRPRDYDRTAVMRLIHECMGIPASPPATSEDSEVDSDSPPSRSTSIVQPIPIQIIPQQEKPVFNPQLIRIDEHTMQLHFTPFYFGI